MTTLSSLYKETKTTFTKAGIETAALDARLFLEALGYSKEDLIINRDKSVSEADINKMQDIVRQRVSGRSVGLILGQREFWGLPFKVTKDVLEPRPDSETVIEAVMRSFGSSDPQYILDLGTGSGCLLLSLLHEYPQAKGVGVDISTKALSVARENARTLGVGQRAEFIESDWFSAVQGNFDCIIANPPYIPSADISNLQREVKDFDPILALDGGKDGLNSYKKIFSQIKSYFSTGGRAFFECGFDQAEQLRRLAANEGLQVESLITDLGGIPRVVEICIGEK